MLLHGSQYLYNSFSLGNFYFIILSRHVAFSLRIHMICPRIKSASMTANHITLWLWLGYGITGLLNKVELQDILLTVNYQERLWMSSLKHTAV